MDVNHLISKPPNQYYRPYLAIAHQVSYSSYPLVLKNLFLKRHTKKRNTTALHTVTGLQQSTKGTQKQYFSFRGPVNMAQKKKPKKLTCMTFLCMICTQEQNVSILCFASIVQQFKWPSRSRKIVEIQKFCHHGNVTSHFSSLLTELWKTSLSNPRRFATHHCINRYG